MPTTSPPDTTATRPAGPRARRRRAAPDRRPLAGVLGVTAVSLAGSVLALRTGLDDSWWEAVGPTGRLSVPLPMNAALLVLAVVAGSTRRRPAVVAGALLALAVTVAVVSGAFDGGYAAALGPTQRLAQVVLVLGLLGVAGIGVARVVGLRRAQGWADGRPDGAGTP
ncbi:hypothetical protein [Oryzobacter terrae]|uniref:hypothetical protein n=1 Tax=Oryzobacter terrae TaxID=1620385 RepID=UPI003671619D